MRHQKAKLVLFGLMWGTFVSACQRDTKSPSQAPECSDQNCEQNAGDPWSRLSGIWKVSSPSLGNFLWTKVLFLKPERQALQIYLAKPGQQGLGELMAETELSVSFVKDSPDLLNLKASKVIFDRYQTERFPIIGDEQETWTLIEASTQNLRFATSHKATGLNTSSYFGYSCFDRDDDCEIKENYESAQEQDIAPAMRPQGFWQKDILATDNAVVRDGAYYCYEALTADALEAYKSFPIGQWISYEQGGKTYLCRNMPKP